MNIQILCLFTFILNFYGVFGEPPQCQSIETFMNENNIPIPTKDENCCFVDSNEYEPPYVVTKCENNIITEIKIDMKEKTVFDTLNFPELPGLQSLSLNNFIFKESVLNGLWPTKDLFISNAILTEISIPQNINIESLSIINSNLEKITNLPSSILYLKLSNNKLTNLDVNLLINVKYFDLSYNKLTNLDVNVLKSVRQLKLSGNPLKDECFENITNELNQLEELELDSCGITKIPKTINKISDLKILNLSKNSIEVLPNEIYELGNLEELNINMNNGILRGKFDFDHPLQCNFNPNYLCVTDLLKQACTNEEGQTQNECTKEYLEELDIKFKEVYESEKINRPGKPLLTIVIILLVIVIILLISFAVFYFKYKYNKQKQLFIKYGNRNNNTQNSNNSNNNNNNNSDTIFNVEDLPPSYNEVVDEIMKQHLVISSKFKKK